MGHKVTRAARPDANEIPEVRLPRCKYQPRVAGGEAKGERTRSLSLKVTVGCRREKVSESVSGRASDGSAQLRSRAETDAVYSPGSIMSACPKAEARPPEGGKGLDAVFGSTKGSGAQKSA